MEEFVFDVAPASTTKNVKATISKLQNEPQNFFQGSDIVWMLLSSGLVWLMVPAICLFYSGASARLSSLRLFRLPLITAATIGFQWYLWGYTLAFTPAVPPSSGPPSVSWYGWDKSGLALSGPLLRPVGVAGGPKIPELVFVLYEGMFASFTAALVSGGTVRVETTNNFPSSDVPVGRFLLFINLWSLIVYIPVARWTWHWSGWSNQLGVLDYAGGTAVHVTSGTACLAYYVFYALETRKARKTSLMTTPETPAVLPDPDAVNYSEVEDPEDEHGASEQPVGALGHELQEWSPAPANGQPLQPASPPARGSNAVFTGTAPITASPPREHGHRSIPVDSTGLASNPASAALIPQDHTNEPPHNANNVVLGTALLWIGWLGFNGGSALGGNMRAVSACISTHVAACAGGTCFLLLFWFWNDLARRKKKKEESQTGKALSVTQFCDGVMVGLVAITPGAGYVPVWSSALIAIIAAGTVFFFKKFTGGLLADKPLYIFAIHTGGGVVGMILTGAFASPEIVALDGYSSLPFLERTPGVRVGYQIVEVLAGFSYTFVMTLVILYGLMVVRFFIRWKWDAGFEVLQKPGRWKLEAVPQHEWRREVERPPQAPEGA